MDCTPRTLSICGRFRRFFVAGTDSKVEIVSILSFPLGVEEGATLLLRPPACS